MVALNGMRLEVIASTSGPPPPTRIFVKRRKLKVGDSGTPDELWELGTDEERVEVPYDPFTHGYRIVGRAEWQTPPVPPIGTMEEDGFIYEYP